MLRIYNNDMEISSGAILYTIVDSKINYLLILDFHNNWGFPKGHIENNETEQEAAEREIYEEVGINANINTTFRHELIYKMPNGIEKHSIYFIGEYTNQSPIKQLEEVKEIKLASFDDAMNLLSFDNMKEILIKANDYIKSII